MKPMLACNAPSDTSKLRFPLIAQPKLDGIRFYMDEAGPRTRSGKMIPNRALCNRLSHLPVGYDGELVCYPHDAQVFQRTQSIVMSHIHPDTHRVTIVLFDCNRVMPAIHRQKVLRLMTFPAECGDTRVCDMRMIYDADELEEYYRTCVEAEYEGVMVRAVNGEYKQGRSTQREQLLMKMKPRDDAEAVVTGCKQWVDKNGNPHEMIGMLICRMGDIEFGIGTGFDHNQRREIYSNFESYKGRQLTFYYQGLGSKGAPRFPAFKAWRQ